MPKYKSQAEENLVVARISMLLKQPFFGTLAMKLRLREVNETQFEKMRTAAVDGRNLWYHTDFIDSLDNEERMFLVGHEVMHCVFDHLYRRHDRQPDIWNMAADYVINAALVEAGMKMPQIGLYDEKFHNWTTEDVYDYLIENNAQSKPTLDCHAGDPNFPGEKSDDGKGGGEPGDNETEGGGNCPSDGMTEAERQELADEWKDALIQAAAAAAGNVPAGLQRLIRELTEPKMDWRQLIQVHLQSCIRNDYTWMRPNKRTFGTGITLPSMDMDDHVELAIAVDTSGSMTEEMLRDLLSEVKGICDTFSSYTIHIACFDTEVYNPQSLTQDDDILSYEPKGGGGTDFMAWWNWAVEQEWVEDIQKILFFTDGYPCGEWGTEGVADTLWLVHGSKNEGPFGVTVFYEDHLKDK